MKSEIGKKKVKSKIGKKKSEVGSRIVSLLGFRSLLGRLCHGVVSKSVTLSPECPIPLTIFTTADYRVTAKLF